MSVVSVPASKPSVLLTGEPVMDPPLLETGDRLSAVEFHARYSRMPEIKKAELIEGIVFVASPTRFEHASPHSLLTAWAKLYALRHPGVYCADNLSVKLDADNEVQPDVLLGLPPEPEKSRLQEGYFIGPPELVVEIAYSSVSIDLHSKKNAYRRCGVREYIVWRVRDGAVDCYENREGTFYSADLVDGVWRSKVFDGLSLDVAALLRGEEAKAIGV